MSEWIRNFSKLKWTGTILCLIGIGLTSFNIYPINIFFGLVGSCFWMIAGLRSKDLALVLVEGVAACLYFTGIMKVFL